MSFIHLHLKAYIISKSVGEQLDFKIPSDSNHCNRFLNGVKLQGSCYLKQLCLLLLESNSEKDFERKLIVSQQGIRVESA